MPKPERLKLIDEIQKKRGSMVVSYITSTRQGLEIPMAMDCIRRIFDHIQLFGKTRKELKLDLFIHTNGGDGTVPWRLVTLVREYASRFSVLVPYKCFSAGTLTALGADEIVMHPMGMLGPTDPTVTTPFNPPNPMNPGQPFGISVEDVIAYLALVREDAGINHEDQLVEPFKALADKVHPLALGSVKRFLSQSRMMARKLLALHMTKTDEHRINEIVDSLTSKLFYHGHPINRQQARDQIGLATVKDAGEIEALMWQLYLDYEAETRMEEPFNGAFEYVAQQPVVTGPLSAGVVELAPPSTATLGFIESAHRTDMFTAEYQLSAIPQPNGATQVLTLHRRQGWSVH